MDLPDPDSPTMPTVSPAATVTSSPDTISLRCPAIVASIIRSFTASNGAALGDSALVIGLFREPRVSRKSSRR